MTDTRPLFTLGAFAVILDEGGRVLLCHRRDMDAWNLPGGGVEALELPDECVVREVREETGLEVEAGRMVGVYGKAERNELVFAFLCRVTGGRLQVTDESDACRYFDPAALPENLLAKHRDRIDDALRMANDPAAQPVIRRQAAARPAAGSSAHPVTVGPLAAAPVDGAPPVAASQKRSPLEGGA